MSVIRKKPLTATEILGRQPGAAKLVAPPRSAASSRSTPREEPHLARFKEQLAAQLAAEGSISGAAALGLGRSGPGLLELGELALEHARDPRAAFRSIKRAVEPAIQNEGVASLLSVLEKDAEVMATLPNGTGAQRQAILRAASWLEAESFPTTVEREPGFEAMVALLHGAPLLDVRHALNTLVETRPFATNAPIIGLSPRQKADALIVALRQMTASEAAHARAVSAGRVAAANLSDSIER